VIEQIEEDFEKINNLSIAQRLKQFVYTPRQYISADDEEIACASLTDEENIYASNYIILIAQKNKQK